jgi:NAD(P)-dependent dehydrogenase (short-subunit alcohol dehydrogenase family)
MAGRLAGKVCVITGTGGSMGRATALTFAREGASVVGCDVTAEPAAATVEMVRAAGGRMVSLQPCHLGDPAECARLVELAVSEFGRIDVLYNLAEASPQESRVASSASPSSSGWASSPRAGHCWDADLDTSTFLIPRPALSTTGRRDGMSSYVTSVRTQEAAS